MKLPDIHILVKYLLSFRKKEWDFEDYPYATDKQNNRKIAEELPLDFSDFRPANWTAHIKNWWMLIGFGDTEQEAINSLRTRFEEFKKSGQPLPRPGTKVPIIFPEPLDLGRLKPLAEDFFKRIIKMDLNDCLITDGSSLWDFLLPKSKAELFRDIMLAYKVDVSDVEDGLLLKIFERIDAHRHRS